MASSSSSATSITAATLSPITLSNSIIVICFTPHQPKDCDEGAYELPKCRAKALKLVASANGVSFVGLEGDEKEKVVVIGDGVDVVKLTNCLRKKVGHTDILSVAAAK